MQKIAVILPTDHYHPALNRISLSLADGFASLGESVVTATITSRPEMLALYKMLADGEIRLLVGVNDTASAFNDGMGDCYLAKLNTPTLSYLLDAPYNTCAGDLSFQAPHKFIAVVDRSHAALIPKLYSGGGDPR